MGSFLEHSDPLQGNSYRHAFESVLTKVYFGIILGYQGVIHSVPTAFMNAVGTE